MQHLDEGTIHAWLDGALSAEEARQAEAHVASCESCAAAVAEARGLIAASSMILSKLDTFPASIDAGSGGAVPPDHDIAAARAAADARQHPARRSWFASSGFRAAAAVLVLAGGVAVVQSVTGREELARVVNDQALESRVEGAESVAAAPMVAQDATAAAPEQLPAPPPQPVVAAAPVHPRPQAVVGGGAAASRQAEPALPARIADGTLAGVEGDTRREAATVTAAPTTATVGSVTGAAALEAAPPRRLEERLRRVERPLQSDLAQAEKAAAPAPPPSPAANSVTGLAETLADSARALQGVRRATEQVPAAQRLAPPAAAAPSGRLSRADTATAEESSILFVRRCYALTLGPWTPGTGLPPAAPPGRILLSPDTGTGGPSKGQRLVRPMPGSPEASYQGAWWTEVSPSTLVLTWSTGSEGIIMRLVRSGDELTGTARTFGTAGGAEQSSGVQAERVDCGAAR